MIKAPAIQRVTRDISGQATRNAYIAARQMPPEILIVQCVCPRHSISIILYKAAPVIKEIKYAALFLKNNHPFMVLTIKR